MARGPASTRSTSKGWQGLKPKEADDGWQTRIMSSYECLPVDLGSAADEHTDGMNYEAISCTTR